MAMDTEPQTRSTKADDGVHKAYPAFGEGSCLDFDDRGEHDLKGVPGPWQLFATRF